MCVAELGDFVEEFPEGYLEQTGLLGPQVRWERRRERGKGEGRGRGARERGEGEEEEEGRGKREGGQNGEGGGGGGAVEVERDLKEEVLKGLSACVGVLIINTL